MDDFQKHQSQDRHRDFRGRTRKKRLTARRRRICDAQKITRKRKCSSSKSTQRKLVRDKRKKRMMTKNFRFRRIAILIILSIRQNTSLSIPNSVQYFRNLYSKTLFVEHCSGARNIVLYFRGIAGVFSLKMFCNNRNINLSFRAPPPFSNFYNRF